MRVKRLEIQGFKSFKDKTLIHFDHNITGIVGPNGCGKSNIVDAFFWVMGEQSYKHMRGTGSDDLIFNGSSRFSPLGMAEATLVMETPTAADTEVDLENQPAGASFADPLTETKPQPPRMKEISVTRRLYRSGEGEYFINGTQARLKDIQELFMDTGVGAKGYSVIEQGQIGKVVNAKPEERRLLIEEAAGIAKYKARKKESLRKMEATQANLARLTDIIQEIEKSLNSLERQAQKARLYRKYKDELFDKEITWGRKRSRVFHRNLEALQKKKEAVEQELAALKAELQIAENSIEVEQVHLITENKSSEVLQAQVQTLSEELSHHRSSLELSRRRQDDLASQLEMLENERLELESAYSDGLQRLANQETEAEEADCLFQQASTESHERGEILELLRREAQEARTALETTQRELMAGMSQISQLTSQAAALLSKIESAQVQTERLSQQAEAQREKLEVLEQEREGSKTEVATLQEKREALQVEKQDLATKIQEAEANLGNLEKDRNQSLRSTTQLKSKLQSLQELDDSHEGLADGPKAALDWAKTQGKENQIRAFTDTLSVTQGYEVVLEAWLEKRMESLLIEDPSLILPLFEKIQTDKLGRISLQRPIQIPALSLSTENKISDAPLAYLESVGLNVKGQLTEFVRSADSEVQTILQLLLSKVLVIESSAALASFLEGNSFDKLEGWNLVTLDGITVDSNQGLVRGGSFSASGAASVLKRKRAIEELKEQVNEAEARHQDFENQVVQAKENLDLLKTRLQELQSNLQEIEIQTAALNRDIHQTERAYQDAKRQLESLEEDAEHTRQEAEAATEDRQEVQLQLEELLTTQSESEESIQEAKQVLAGKEEILRAKEDEQQAGRVREASLQERAISLKREREATKSLLEDRKRRLSEIQRTLERTSHEQTRFSGDESELSQKVEELTLRLSQTREQLASVKDRLEEMGAKVNVNLEKVKSIHKKTEQKSAEASQFALDAEKISGELSHLILNLEEKYGLGCLSPKRPQSQNLAPPNFNLGVSEENADPSAVEGELTATAAILSSDGALAEEEKRKAEEGLELNHPAEAKGEEKSEIENPLEIQSILPEELQEEEKDLSPEEEIILGEEVEKLRERIRRLGEVNVMAIEEYDQLKLRYDHLVTEKADLERSLENLREAIDHINKTSEERFQKAFDAIASRFERLFPIVFGGGQAKLSLVYPEGSTDILEAGVDILAQPPGKKVSNITLLSGGEKALTAVSLIFAIFMVKPSPFCVLDEVDAPLDDANIGKFNALLREMSSRSQFILITHNKKTMELNDTLYGVTMEEPGVSKMVSIEMH